MNSSSAELHKRSLMLLMKELAATIENSGFESPKAPWQRDGLLHLSPIVIAEDNSDSQEWAQLDYRGDCGPFGGGGKLVYIVNRDGARRMRVTVRVSYYYQGESRSQTATYTVDPSGSINIGCTRPGDALQTFEYSIISAVYA